MLHHKKPDVWINNTNSWMNISTFNSYTMGYSSKFILFHRVGTSMQGLSWISTMSSLVGWSHMYLLYIQINAAWIGHIDILEFRTGLAAMCTQECVVYGACIRLLPPVVTAVYCPRLSVTKTTGWHLTATNTKVHCNASALVSCARYRRRLHYTLWCNAATSAFSRLITWLKVGKLTQTNYSIGQTLFTSITRDTAATKWRSQI